MLPPCPRLLRDNEERDTWPPCLRDPLLASVLTASHIIRSSPRVQTRIRKDNFCPRGRKNSSKFFDPAKMFRVTPVPENSKERKVSFSPDIDESYRHQVVDKIKTLMDEVSVSFDGEIVQVLFCPLGKSYVEKLQQKVLQNIPIRESFESKNNIQLKISICQIICQRYFNIFSLEKFWFSICAIERRPLLQNKLLIIWRELRLCALSSSLTELQHTIWSA